MILLDTHIWVRWLTAGDPLPALIVRQIEEADAVAVSAISCWEVAYLVKRGRLKLALPIRDWMDSGLRRADVQCLEIDEQIALQAAQLPDHHEVPIASRSVPRPSRCEVPIAARPPLHTG